MYLSVILIYIELEQYVLCILWTEEATKQHFKLRAQWSGPIRTCLLCGKVKIQTYLCRTNAHSSYAAVDVQTR